jgi:hypothetical protein
MNLNCGESLDERMGLDLSQHSESAYASGTTMMKVRPQYQCTDRPRRSEKRHLERKTPSSSPGPGKSSPGKGPVSTQDVKNK